MATMNVKDAAGSTVAVEKPLAPGTAADSASRPVAWSTEGKAQIGALTETAPASDTASSGLNGRLQRIAQRLSSLIALLPTALGANGGLKVEGVASGTAVPVSGTVTVTNYGNAFTRGSGSVDSNTQRIAMASDSPGVIATAAPGTLSSAGISATVVNPSNYETVAASATAQVIGSTGATGDFIQGLLVIPATTSPGNVLLLDNATSITVFAGGATSVSNLVPFFIPLGMTSVSGAWKVTTGTNVSVIAVGKFT